MKTRIRIDDMDFLELEQDNERKVIFLDIDGVLNKDNSGPKIEECFVKRLAHIVGMTGAEIVLSSSWRGAYVNHMNPENHYQNRDTALLISMLEKYQMRIMDVTPNITSGSYARPLEIRAWLLERGNLQRFVILDDETFWAWNWLGDYLVCTTHLDGSGKPVCGLTDGDAEKAIAILNRPIADSM